MSEYTNLSDFSSEGFDLGRDAKVMTYLHGLSDFWVYLFDDASKVNLMMEANALTASDTYNKFLQLTSVISLEGISTLTNSQIKLILVSDEDNTGVANPKSGKVPGKVETYFLPSDSPLKYARVLADRAFLPTVKLENEADFYIHEDLGQISFAKPLSEIGFPFRYLENGAKQYGIWAVDAKVDDQLVYNYYAKLININPTSSTDLFKNFVYGLYFLYVNGPHMDTMRRGLNITLGIPLARNDEQVLEIRKYLNTDQWLVITDLNSYLIPYGLEPSVEIDQQLVVGQEIAEWIEVKDYTNDGEWWINFMLPAHLMPHIPLAVAGGGEVAADSVPDRYMVEGSYADWLMRNYLKKHTFLVNVKTLGFKNIQSFEQLAKIIHDTKPAYTTPVYVWTVGIEDDILVLVDEVVMSRTYSWQETLTDGIGRFYRNNTVNPHTRGLPQFIRISVPTSLDDQTGYAAELNGSPRSFQDGYVTGFIGPYKSYRAPTGQEAAWSRTLRTRNQSQYLPRRGLLDFRRDYTATGDGEPVWPYADRYAGYRLVPLYTTTFKDVVQKFATIGLEAPTDQYIFELFRPSYDADLINVHDIGGALEHNWYEYLQINYEYYFKKGSNGRYLGPLFPLASYDEYIPRLHELTPSDFLVFTRIDSVICGVYWATQNFSAETIPYRRHDEHDQLTITTSGQPTRGMIRMGSPYFQLRSTNLTISYNTGNAINDKEINEPMEESTVLSVTYSDESNPSLRMDRGAKTLIAKRVFK